MYDSLQWNIIIFEKPLGPRQHWTPLKTVSQNKVWNDMRLSRVNSPLNMTKIAKALNTTDELFQAILLLQTKSIQSSVIPHHRVINLSPSKAGFNILFF